MPSFYPENNAPQPNDPEQRILNKILSALVGAGGGGSGSSGASSSGVSGAVTDGSGTITTGGTAQSLFAANADRKYLFVENLSNESLWIDFGTTAVEDQPSIEINPDGGSFVMESGFIDNQSVSIIGPTTSQSFTAKEG